MIARRIRERGLLAGAVLIAATGCSGSPGAEEGPRFAYAYAFPDCAPWDGSAVSIYLTSVPYDSASGQVAAPFLQLAIWKNADAELETRIRWPSEESEGGASSCVVADQCSAAVSGHVRVSGLGADSTMSGEYDVQFADSSSMGGRFTARWVNRRMLCG